MTAAPHSSGARGRAGQGTVAGAHPVAQLLTDEQRARVGATRFEQSASGITTAGPSAYRRCPLAVAVGLERSMRSAVYCALGLNEPQRSVESFMGWADSIYSDPADVYTLLGCDPPLRGPHGQHAGGEEGP
jgi:hypothetical protein